MTGQTGGDGLNDVGLALALNQLHDAAKLCQQVLGQGEMGILGPRGFTKIQHVKGGQPVEVDRVPTALGDNRRDHTGLWQDEHHGRCRIGGDKNGGNGFHQMPTVHDGAESGGIENIVWRAEQHPGGAL